jgi:hypothetical protein
MKSNKEIKEHTVTVWQPSPNQHLVAKKTLRNATCKCGSGKKAKHCCGAETKYYQTHNFGHIPSCTKPEKQ